MLALVAEKDCDKVAILWYDGMIVLLYVRDVQTSETVPFLSVQH